MENKVFQLVIIDGKYYFQDEKGNLSKDSYYYAENYKNGFALVLKEAGGRFFFRDLNGKLRKDNYFYATSYSNGLAAVRKEENEKMYFLDLNGQLSEDCYETIFDGASRHPAYVVVREDAGSCYKYRDGLGNLTYENVQTDIGDDYYNYIHNKITVFDLYDEYFGNEKFLKAIMKHEEELLIQAYEHCRNFNDIERLNNLKENISEYIKDKAYEQYVLKNPKILKDEIKKAQNTIGKMF